LAGSLAEEYESGALDMLRLTLLSPWDIVYGKLFAGIAVVTPLALLTGILNLSYWRLLFETHLNSYAMVFTGFTTLVVCVFLSQSISLFASIVTRGRGAGLVLSYCLNFMIFIGFFLMWWGLVVTRIFFMPERYAGLFSPIIAQMLNAWLHGACRPLRTYDGSLISPYWIASVGIYVLLCCLLIVQSVFTVSRGRRLRR
jgi:hypothetical protein